MPREPASRALDRYELAHAADQKFESLSGGQQARFQILLLELSGATLLLLDEPTDNLDVESAEALEEGLERFEGTVLAVTHDRWFARDFDRYLVYGADGSVYESDGPVWDEGRVGRGALSGPVPVGPATSPRPGGRAWSSDGPRVAAVPRRSDVVPAPLLVLGGVVSVQFGGALAATLVPEIGAGGSVLLRIGIAALILLAVARPRLRGHAAQAWPTVVAFGVALGLMNWSFYGSLAHLPLGVAVTVEFLGPLVLTTVLSRRLLDFVAVLAAAAGCC